MYDISNDFRCLPQMLHCKAFFNLLLIIVPQWFVVLWDLLHTSIDGFELYNVASLDMFFIDGEEKLYDDIASVKKCCKLQWLHGHDVQMARKCADSVPGRMTGR